MENPFVSTLISGYTEGAITFEGYDGSARALTGIALQVKELQRKLTLQLRKVEVLLCDREDTFALQQALWGFEAAALPWKAVGRTLESDIVTDMALYYIHVRPDLLKAAGVDVNG